MPRELLKTAEEVGVGQSIKNPEIKRRGRKKKLPEELDLRKILNEADAKGEFSVKDKHHNTQVIRFAVKDNKAFAIAKGSAAKEFRSLNDMFSHFGTNDSFSGTFYFKCSPDSDRSSVNFKWDCESKKVISEYTNPDIQPKGMISKNFNSMYIWAQNHVLPSEISGIEKQIKEFLRRLSTIEALNMQSKDLTHKELGNKIKRAQEHFEVIIKYIPEIERLQSKLEFICMKLLNKPLEDVAGKNVDNLSMIEARFYSISVSLMPELIQKISNTCGLINTSKDYANTLFAANKPLKMLKNLEKKRSKKPLITMENLKAKTDIEVSTNDLRNLHRLFNIGKTGMEREKGFIYEDIDIENIKTILCYCRQGMSFDGIRILADMNEIPVDFKNTDTRIPNAERLNEFLNTNFRYISKEPIPIYKQAYSRYRHGSKEAKERKDCELVVKYLSSKLEECREIIEDDEFLGGDKGKLFNILAEEISNLSYKPVDGIRNSELKAIAYEIFKRINELKVDCR